MDPAQQPDINPDPRIAVEPYYFQPYRASRSNFLDHSSPGLESPTFFLPPADPTPMQPNFPPISRESFLCFDHNCQYNQQINSDSTFSGVKYPHHYHTFCSAKPSHFARCGGINMATPRWIGDPCFTAAGNFSSSALLVRGNNADSLFNDSGPMKIFSPSNIRQTYNYNFPSTGSVSQVRGIRINDTKASTTKNYNIYSPTTRSKDTRASGCERNNSNKATRINDLHKFSEKNTHTEVGNHYNQEVINSSEPSTFRYTRDNGLESAGNFNNFVDNTRRNDIPAIFTDSDMDTSLFKERITFYILTGSGHNPSRVRNNAHHRNPRSLDLHTNVSSPNQVSKPNPNLNLMSTESENYANIPPLAPPTYTTITHPTSQQNIAPDKNTKNTKSIEPNTKGETMEACVSSFNPLDPASPEYTTSSSASIKFKAYKCCSCNTSHHEPFTSDQDICYNCNHTVCRACYNFWECCNCNSLGRFKNHICEDCEHEKCPRKCLFQIITKEAWLRIEALRATENRGTPEQQKSEKMYKLGRVGDSGKTTREGRSRDNVAPVNASIKPGTVGEKEEALRSLVTLREKVKASSKCPAAIEPPLAAAPSHNQDQGPLSIAVISGSIITVRTGGDQRDNEIHSMTPKRGDSNSTASMAQSPLDSEGSSDTSFTGSSSTLPQSPKTPLESPVRNHRHSSQIFIDSGSRRDTK
ncbi:hypothetical protein L873DRAFT_561511 [Choiromyces venosus 120613-1]|uniref:RING-type domain-containing protein n=1 Tax=Choiromyces venosus 120613-1 TaxID=1336337 RepID=A0A3N4JUA0_9PEZI|nr:hypothetical protein L873DRAFT_561511 [Choiromyces venosus 120613-1]